MENTLDLGDDSQDEEESVPVGLARRGRGRPPGTGRQRRVSPYQTQVVAPKPGKRRTKEAEPEIKCEYFFTLIMVNCF
jgi:hypothetical protein